jgi:uncharacterized protein (DUF433 family)
MDIQQYIELDSSKRFGQPILKGTRIAVKDVLNWLANEMTVEDIKIEFPELIDEQIYACLFYAASKEGHLGIAS